MAKTKTTHEDEGADQMTRIRGPFARQLKVLAKRRLTGISDEANRAVLELLEREGLWPVKGTS